MTLNFGNGAVLKNDLQHTLNIFHLYCKKWKLKINSNKTKIVIFNGTTRDYKHIFKIGNTILENVKEYKYLGITFTKLNNFRTTKSKLRQQVTKVMYYVLSKSKDNHLSIECKLKMFDSLVLPVLLYGCEIYGYEKTDLFNSVQINFFRHILPVKKSTPLFMLYGELGRMPIELTVHRRMVCYWARLLSGKELQFSTLLYKAMLNDYLTNGTDYKWITTIKDILEHLGMGDIWASQSFIWVNCLTTNQTKTI